MTSTSQDRQTKTSRIQVKKRSEGVVPTPESIEQPAHARAELSAKIERRAYALYLERGCRQGCALEDWLDAEREMLTREPPV